MIDPAASDARLAIVTGASGGLGYETALGLAQRGFDVVLAVRDARRGESAAARIRASAPSARLRVERLDLADQASVAAFAEARGAEGRPVHILVNNAGVMALPRREVTVDGFELQLATNYLGHFALTAHLRPLLTAGGARVVQLASLAHHRGRIHLHDLKLERGYTPWTAYCQSKLVMLMFALELHERSAANGWGLTSVAAHPGWAATSIIDKGPAQRTGGRFIIGAARLLEPLFAQTAAAGAEPILQAATDPFVQGGAYLGPQGPGETRGPSGPARIGSHARDPEVRQRLWAETERLLGVSFG